MTHCIQSSLLIGIVAHTVNRSGPEGASEDEAQTDVDVDGNSDVGTRSTTPEGSSPPEPPPPRCQGDRGDINGDRISDGSGSPAAAALESVRQRWGSGPEQQQGQLDGNPMARSSQCAQDLQTKPSRPFCNRSDAPNIA